MKNKFILPLILVAAVSLTSCSNAKEKLGLVKNSPDEFAVVKRAPLAMPPDYALRPPSPGAPRPQEQSPQEAAKQTVFGTAQTGTTTETQPVGPDSVLLGKAGATNADPSIRQKVDAETAILGEKKKPVVKRIFGMGGPEDAATNVVDAKAEAERLKKNQQAGQPVTKGETPSVEQ